jgi:hypothetical protein
VYQRILRRVHERTGEADDVQPAVVFSAPAVFELGELNAGTAQLRIATEELVMSDDVPELRVPGPEPFPRFGYDASVSSVELTRRCNPLRTRFRARDIFGKSVFEEISIDLSKGIDYSDSEETTLPLAYEPGLRSLRCGGVSSFMSPIL